MSSAKTSTLTWAVRLVQLGVLAAVGGYYTQRWLWSRPVELAAGEVRSLTLTTRDGRAAICPREGTPLRLSATVDRGSGPRALESWSDPLDKRDKLDFADFVFSSDLGRVTAEGVFLPDPDLLRSVARPLRVVVAPKHDPSLTATLELPPSYACVTRAGRAGAGGAAGVMGRDGVAPQPEADGGRGADGGAGPQLLAYVSVVSTPWFPALIAVRFTGAFEDLLLAPLDRPLTLFADGGSGGGGGRGGQPKAPTARGGAGGDGGAGGAGGALDVVLDPRFPQLRQLIQGSVDGGAPGLGGAPGGSGRAGAAGSRGRPGRLTIAPGPVDGAFLGLDGVTRLERLP